MRTTEEEKLFNETKNSLERIQGFDVIALPREDELGKSFSFSAAVEPAKRLIVLFQRVSVSILEDLPQGQLTQIRDATNNSYNILKQILDFDPTQADASTVQQGLIQQLTNSYSSIFPTIYPFISYSLYKSADFQRLDYDARATLQRIEDEATKLKKELEAYKTSAEKILDEVRAVAAEQGVTQQAFYFKEEADFHKAEAEKWRERTVKSAWMVGVYAVLSIVLHKIPWIAPENTYQAVQLSVSKILIFGVMSFMLYLSAKNFLSHLHNAIVNRHRLNALMTYRAIAEAAGDTGQEAILIHAAACIYSPQPTGYTSGDVNQLQGAKSIIELLAKPVEKS